MDFGYATKDGTSVTGFETPIVEGLLDIFYVHYMG